MGIEKLSIAFFVFCFFPHLMNSKAGLDFRPSTERNNWPGIVNRMASRPVLPQSDLSYTSQRHHLTANGHPNVKCTSLLTSTAKKAFSTMKIIILDGLIFPTT